MKDKLEKTLFESHPFLGPLVAISVCGLPWWIAFWPGTLQHDSCGQLLQFYGVGKMTGHHPLPVTMVMGFFMQMGRIFFHSDNAGIFLYTVIQFVVQSIVLSYAFCVFKKISVPMWMRWGGLFFYALFPFVPNWGISYCKDTGYYISFLLFILVSIDVFIKGNGKAEKWQRMIWILALVCIAAFRNDGRYVVGISVLALMLFYREYWKTYIIGIGTVIVFLVLVESVYMPLRKIPAGSIREALSIPLMQTAYYVKEYPEEVTKEEEVILLSVFSVENLKEISDVYDSEISDDVKGLFKEYPRKEEVSAYFNVWWAQLRKHPMSYIWTYLEHCDGYFNPVKKSYEDIIGWFKILDSQSRCDQYLEIYFGMEDRWLRDKMENWTYILYNMPLIGLLYHPGTHTWIMSCCLGYLLWKRRKRESAILIPGYVVLLICTLSPLNASVRYYLPVMVTTPIYIAFCAADHRE